ncbi:hypothetical protein [Geoalkalibacter sp.]|uniref:hypothetical protein n=1 Tax=Geoalkalibacter sp. TaxID=3041440 RepID=UPI00272ECB90|nr:hypothetical protein [Geoalkalibacter sp.]
MRSLVDGLGLSFGLPDQPEDEDYRRILSGRRNLRIEAEETLDPDSLVSIKDFTNFGEFSGSGWVSGIASPTTARLEFVLPLAGDYRVKAVIRLPDHVIRLDGKEFSVSGENLFTPVDLGILPLDAGMLEVELRLPPNGAIDYLEFQAVDLPEIAPIGGWQPDRPLGRVDLAVTALQALGVDHLLPRAAPDLALEAENAEDPGGATVVTTRYLGAPSGGRWLRATTTNAEVLLSFSITHPAFYRIDLIGAGSLPAGVRINEGRQRDIAWPSYLAPASAGGVYLERGRHQLKVLLPPGSGFDLVHLRGLRSRPEDLASLAGMGGFPEVPHVAELDALLALLAALGPLP